MLFSIPRRHGLSVLFLLAWLLWCVLDNVVQAQPAAPVPEVLAPIRPLEQEQPFLPQPESPTPSLVQRRPADQQAQPPVELTDQDLARNIRLTEMILNQAMVQEDWDTLRRIMRFYPWMQGADPILRDYVQGALLRHDGDYKKAIALYQQIVDQHPDLDYVRLELAIMQFENKQYQQAEQNFVRAREGQMERAAHLNAQRYQLGLAQQRRWKFSLQGGLAYNSNLNSANKDKYMYIPLAIADGGTYWLPFAKGEDNLPKSAWGFKYQADAALERNISGNHFYTVNGDLNGVAYNNHSDYTDVAVNLAVGYKYQDIRRWLAVTPQVNKTWMGGEVYSHSHGVGLDYGYLPNRKWQLMASYLWLKRTYDDKSYALYDGDLHILSATAVHVWNPAFVTFGGVGWQRESVQSGEYSSKYPWAQLGVIMNAKNVLAGRFSVRYGEKSFDDPYQLFLRTKRKDREWRFSSTLWKPGFSIVGMEPKLNFSYTRMKSNLPVYSRNRTEFSLMFEKKF